MMGLLITYLKEPGTITMVTALTGVMILLRLTTTMDLAIPAATTIALDHTITLHTGNLVTAEAKTLLESVAEDATTVTLAEATGAVAITGAETQRAGVTTHQIIAETAETITAVATTQTTRAITTLVQTTTTGLANLIKDADAETDGTVRFLAHRKS
jgi:hypothetical protein